MRNVSSPNKYLKLIIFDKSKLFLNKTKQKPSRPKDMLERDNLSSIS